MPLRSSWGVPHPNTWRRGFADLGYTLKATQRWDMSFNATYTRNTFDNPGYPNIGRDSQEVLLEWTNSIAFSNRDRLTLGTLFNHAEGQETYFGLDTPIEISNGSRPGGAFYGQWDHQLADTVKLVGGFQVNKIDGTAVSVVPRAGLIWNPTAHVGVKAIYSGAFRAPSINETTLDHPGLQGTPGLKPEKVATLDLSVSYEANRFQGALTYFRSRQTDSIVVDTRPVRAVLVNLGGSGVSRSGAGREVLPAEKLLRIGFGVLPGQRGWRGKSGYHAGPQLRSQRRSQLPRRERADPEHVR